MGEILADCTSGSEKSSRDKKADTSTQETHKGEQQADTPNSSQKDKGFFEWILENIGYKTDNVKAVNAEADKLLRESVENGKDLKDLSGAEKRRLHELYSDNKGFFEFNSMEASLEKEYNRLKEKQNIAQIKDPKDLTQEQREIIADDLGAIQNAWDYFFTDEKEVLQQWQENYKAKNEILPQTQKAIAFLDNIHKHKSISNVIESAYKGEMNKEAFEDYLGEVEKIATTAGFDEIGYNKKKVSYTSTKERMPIKSIRAFLITLPIFYRQI
ncbi:hypothetical protein [Helicobacter labetoulli]|uniref:hypothetical protein n=1 Tax=Helicobacter labetoulli TaxID=2315333 RepID=UPI001300964D|nr:hypothetical protein [Helicobacter labetoulli]